MSLQECTTADDVRKLARRTLDRRREMMKPPKPPERPIAIPIQEIFAQAIPIPINRVESPMTVISVPEPSATICPSLAIIIDAVAKRFGVTPLDIKSDRRPRNLVVPRQTFMYLARRLTIKSLPQIGLYIGGRDHTTIMHGVARIEQLRGDNAELDQSIRELEIIINQMAAEAVEARPCQ